MQIALDIHPIATAPKDRVILLFGECWCHRGEWCELFQRWNTPLCWVNPSHWCKLPTLPKEAGE